MIFVDQTEFGAENGNCYPACLASILGVPVSVIPHFCRDYHYWQQAANEWLALLGVGFLSIDWPPMDVTCLPECVVILGGKSPRGEFHHAVIGRLHRNSEPEVLHDPHPSRSGLRTITVCDLFLTLAPQPVEPRRLPDPRAWRPSNYFNLPRGTPHPQEIKAVF